MQELPCAITEAWRRGGLLHGYGEGPVGGSCARVTWYGCERVEWFQATGTVITIHIRTQVISWPYFTPTLDISPFNTRDPSAT